VVVLAAALDRAGRSEEALASLRAVAAIRPDHLPVTFERIRLLVEAGKADQGVALADAAVRATPGSAAVARQVARVLQEAGAPAAARRIVDAALARWPRDAGLFVVSGSLHERQGELAAAEEDFRRAMAEEPGSATARNYLGYMLADRGLRLKEAEALIREALLLRPHEAAYLDSLGWALVKQDRLADAEAALEAAAFRDRDPVIVMHLGTLREEQGRSAEALALYREALRYGLSEEVPRVERRVQELAAVLERGP
jgi:tetratricopeptide (TPR) repeat protein